MGMRIQSPRSAIVYSDINVELSAAPIVRAKLEALR
jgi:hypothetical protein